MGSSSRSKFPLFSKWPPEFPRTPAPEKGMRFLTLKLQVSGFPGYACLQSWEEGGVFRSTRETPPLGLDGKSLEEFEEGWEKRKLCLH